MRASQFGFIPDKSTLNPIFTLRQAVQKYRKVMKIFHLVFVDIEKAYDIVFR